jgi:hypothetical protein
MTRAYKVRAGIIAVAVLVVVTAGVLLLTQRRQAPPLSLVFERYSTKMDFFVEDVAFLWLTNLSDKPYGLPMTGGTNTQLQDSPIGLGSLPPADQWELFDKLCVQRRADSPCGSDAVGPVPEPCAALSRPDSRPVAAGRSEAESCHTLCRDALGEPKAVLDEWRWLEHTSGAAAFRWNEIALFATRSAKGLVRP